MVAKLRPDEIQAVLFEKKQREICQSKKKFLDEVSAVAFLRSKNKFRARRMKHLTSYECKWCGFWHLTTKRVE